MNFYNDDENEKKEGAPVLPRAASPFKKTSAFGKTPLFSRTAGSLMDRLKNLSRRDMALVGLGLSVLVMVPVAEYMMSQPPQENLLEGGWGGKEKLGDMPYEPGVNGLSQGSADGSGEVITPLSSRDPVSLILGSQPAQPAVSAPVYTPPVTSMRDAMRDAGREAFSAASKSAGAPTVIPKMAGGLRNMSFFGGGESSRTSGSLGGGKIIDEARSASSKAAKRSMVGPVAMAGYKGVASTPNSASKGAFEKLRAAADKSAGNFSGGSAIRSLDKAAADALEIGKGGGGMGAGGDSEKTGKTSGNSVKGYEHNRSGESLAEAAAKLRQQKALEWEFYKKYEIPKQIINAIVGAVSSVLGDFIKDNLMSAFGMYPPNIKCWNPAVCPNGSNCGDLAVTYLGANWWNNGKKMTDLCSVGGSPVAIKQVVGKESASSTSEVCLCGKGEKPSVGGTATGGIVADPSADPSANPGGNPSATPQHHAQAVVTSMKSYDDQLRNIVTMVAQAEAKKDPKALDDKFVEGVVTGFQNLSPLADDKLQLLRNLKGSVDKANTQFNSDLEVARGKVEAFRPDYEKFNKVWDKLNAECPPVKAGGASECKVKPKVTAGIESALTPAAIATIRTNLAKWDREGRPKFSEADGNYVAMLGWQTAYVSESSTLDKSLTKVENDKQTFFQAVPGANQEGKPALDRLKAITGRFKDIQAPPVEGTPAAKQVEGAATPQTEAQVDPTTTPLYKIASVQRAADWETLWKSPYDLNSTKVTNAEASAFNSWDNADRKLGLELGETKNFVDSHMRATQLSRSIMVRNGGVKKISTDVDDSKRILEEVKKALATYIDGATYDLGATTPAVKPENPDNTAGEVDQPTNIPSGQQGFNKRDPVARAEEAAGKLTARAADLPPASEVYDTRYGGENGVRAKAEKAAQAAQAAFEKYKTAQAASDADPSNADKKQAAAAAQSEFSKASTVADQSLKYASQVASNPNTVVNLPQQTGPKDVVSEADRQKSETRRETLVECVPLTNGWGTLEKKCSLDQAQTVKTGVTFANTQLARGLTDRDVSSIRATVYSACGWVKICNPRSVPAGCGEFNIFPSK